MKRTFFGFLMIIALAFASGAVFAASRTRPQPTRQWAIVNFARTTQVGGYSLGAGEYLIVHDFDKMDRGDPCTSIYAFGESGVGPQDEKVAFHCIPRDRNAPDKTTLTFNQIAGDTGGCVYSWGYTVDKLTEYQFAGDSESHGVPERADAAPVVHEHQ